MPLGSSFLSARACGTAKIKPATSVAAIRTAPGTSNLLQRRKIRLFFTYRTSVCRTGTKQEAAYFHTV
jgi:hypothetical protein